MKIHGKRFKQFVMALLVMSLWLGAGGCLFEPREPDPPSSGSGIKYADRISPRNVWENLQVSLNNRDSFGWEENIHAEFSYLPDGEAEGQYPGNFVDWNYEREMGFIDGFYASGVTVQALMRNPDFNVPEPTGSEVRWEGVVYYLRVTDPNDNSETRYRASAIITFRLDGNFWYIYRWEDQQGETNPDNPTQILPSMGVLRGTFGSKKSF